MRKPWSALGSANYRLYFFGQLISQSGTWMQRIAQSWLVLDLTGSPVALGAVAVLQFAPILLLSLVSGVVADRLPKRQFLGVLQTAAMLQALVFGALVLSHTVQLWHVFVLAALFGVITAFDGPTRQAFVSEMVGRELIQSAVGLNASVFNAARILGPGVGGVLIALVGVGWCFILNGLSYVAVLAALGLMHSERFVLAPRPVPSRLHRQLIDGLRYAFGQPSLLLPLLLVTFIGTFGYNFSVVLPLLARYSFDVGSVGFGIMQAAMGVGALLGALIVASRGSPTSRLLRGTATMFAALLFAVAVAPQFILELLLLAMLGAVGVTYTASTNAALQLRSRDEYRGRVLSLYVLLSSGLTPIGSAFTAAVAAAWDVRIAIAVNAGLCLVGVVIAIAYVARAD
jgi:MFS family permease